MLAYNGTLGDFQNRQATYIADVKNLGSQFANTCAQEERTIGEWQERLTSAQE